MSHHYSGPDYWIPTWGRTHCDLTDLYAFPKPGEAVQVGPHYERSPVRGF